MSYQLCPLRPLYLFDLPLVLLPESLRLKACAALKVAELGEVMMGVLEDCLGCSIERTKETTEIKYFSCYRIEITGIMNTHADLSSLVLYTI